MQYVSVCSTSWYHEHPMPNQKRAKSPCCSRNYPVWLMSRFKLFNVRVHVLAPAANRRHPGRRSIGSFGKLDRCPCSIGTMRSAHQPPGKIAYITKFFAMDRYWPSLRYFRSSTASKRFSRCLHMPGSLSFPLMLHRAFVQQNFHKRQLVITIFVIWCRPGIQ